MNRRESKIGEDNNFTYFGAADGVIITPHDRSWEGCYRLAGFCRVSRIVGTKRIGGAPQYVTIPIRSWDDLHEYEESGVVPCSFGR